MEDYVEFRDISGDIVAPHVEEQKEIKSVKSWFSSYFSTKDERKNDAEIVDTKPKDIEENDKSYWMSDAAVKSCFNCDKEFSLTRRRHHCRFCGQIFCWKCAPMRSHPISVRCCQKCLEQRRKSTSSPSKRRASGGLLAEEIRQTIQPEEELKIF